MLPNELIGACLTFSTGSDLCASARVARAWQHEAELHLYRDASTLSVYALLSAFRARPLRAAYVRALCVLDYGASDAETTRLLRRLPHLRELRLEMCGGLQPGIAWPFSLRRLVVHTDCDELPAHEFVRFLKSQPELRVLELQSLFDDDRQRALCEAATDMQFLPQLESLRSPACVAAALVPGRPVQHVAVQYLYIEDDCTESVLYDALRRSTRPLLTLKVRCRDGFPRALRDAVPQLRNLELLLYRDRLLEVRFHRPIPLLALPLIGPVVRYPA